MKKVYLLILLVLIFSLSTYSTSAQEPTIESSKEGSFTMSIPDPNTIKPIAILAEIKPGSTYTDEVIIENNTDKYLTLELSAVDSYINEDEKYIVKQAIDEQENIGLWTTFYENHMQRLTLKPSEKRTAEFVIQVPENTEYGNYMGSISLNFRGERDSKGVQKSFRTISKIEVKVTDDPQPVPKYSDEIQANLLAPTPFFWGTVAIFVSSMGYLVYSRRKEKKNKQNK